MTTAADILPEDVLVATLYKVGSNVRLVDDDRLARAFGEAAADEGSAFQPFRLHAQYHYSKLLSDTLQILDLGGSIVRENAPVKYFRVSTHTAGSYGQTKFASLPPESRKQVTEVANTIKGIFADSGPSDTTDSGRSDAEDVSRRDQNVR